MAPPLRVGFLHVGPVEHGVTRYGRRIAEAARPTVDVVEASLPTPDPTTASRAAEALSGSDVVHIQWNGMPAGGVWGDGLDQLRNLRAFLGCCQPPVVATVHDLASKLPLWAALRRARRPKAALRPLLRRFGGDRLLHWMALRRSAALIVCTQAEADIAARLAPTPVHVIPHFIEPRALPQIPPTEGRVVTLLGFIFPGKGHRLLVEALPSLPADVRVVFAGGASGPSQWYLDQCLRRASQLGCRDRVQVTGWLEDHEMDAAMAATHLAVCPFRTVSASGSLSTWLGAGRPVLTSHLPTLLSYNEAVPGTVQTFSPYTAGALADAIRHHLPPPGSPPPPTPSAVAATAERLAPARIVDLHRPVWQAAARSAR